MGARPVRRPHARARRRGLPTSGPSRRGAGRERRRAAPHRSSASPTEYTVGSVLVDDVRAAARRRCRRTCWPGTSSVGSRSRSPASTCATEGHVADRRRRRRPVDLRAAAVAEHAVHARLVVLDLRRRLDQPDVLAGPSARGRTTWPRSTRLTRCSPTAVRLLVPAAWATTTASRPRTSGSRRSRAATSRSSATAPSRSASASARRPG